MIDRRKLTPHVRLLADMTGKPLTRITKAEWIEIACRAERGVLETLLTAPAVDPSSAPAGGMLARAMAGALRPSPRPQAGHCKTVAPTAATKPRGRPVTWTAEQAARYLEVWASLKAGLGGGKPISDRETARRLIKRDMTTLRQDKQRKKAEALAKNVGYFRKLANGTAAE